MILLKATLLIFTLHEILAQTVDVGCCSWDLGSCGADAWCNASSQQCKHCNGFFIYPSKQVGCIPRWTLCSETAPCCGHAVCIDQIGWRHCDIRNTPPSPNPTLSPTISATTLPPTTLSPTLKPTPGPKSQRPIRIPTTPKPSRFPTTRSRTKFPTAVRPTPTPATLPSQPPIGPTPSPTTKAPTSPISTQAPISDVIGPNNNSEKVTLPRPPLPQGISQQINCPHNGAGLVDWTSLFPSPGTGAAINIPENTKVVIRQSIPIRLGNIDIPPTSELIVGESANGISIDTTGISVRGKFTIGSETCRLVSKVIITLYGVRPSNAVTNIPDATYKGINVAGGVLNLHGKRYFQTWTRLSATANPGDSFLRLQEDVNWEAGQEIVLVTTAMKDSKEWHQNEVLKVQSVDNSPSVGSIVYLQSSIAYKHVGIRAYQAEVGLLSRSIVVQGSDSDSNPTDSEPRKCNGRWIFGNTDEPCPDKDLTGFGGHIIIQSGGRGFVEGVELFRMGQTNVLGRYPMHFHRLNDCPECYFRDSSVHKSFYRCVSIHGTNNATISENVAFDVIGFCYYLEDGVEQYNKIHYNLGAHIHMIGPSIPNGGGQQTQVYQQSNTLTLPADVTAAAFYVTNIRNEVIGNAASGGWAGFAFPNLPSPIGLGRGVNMRPSSVMPLPGNKLDGNTAHSTAWWWYHSGAFYFGGALYYNSQNVLEYNPGRSFNFNEHNRKTCEVDLCAQGNCNQWCPIDKQAFSRLSNSKVFLAAGVGLNSWSGRMEILGFECHDCGLSVEALESGFWIDNMLSNCRSGEALSLPPGATANYIPGNGFGWYDTDQEHIITRSTFRRCGQTANGGGCGSSASVGCHADSSVFSFLTHSSQFNPEIMQGTKAITMESCGRRFRLADFRGAGYTSVSARLQNWLDEDGSVTGFGVRSVIASAYDNGMWWKPDLETQFVSEGPMYFFKLTSGPQRGLGHFRINFDPAEHGRVGSSVCTNGGFEPCPALGYAKHLGMMFSNDIGLPITAQPDIAGPVGGFGWFLKFNQGSPTKIVIELIEVRPDTPLMIYMAYPPSTSFDIFAFAPYCGNGGCKEQFVRVSSETAVRNSKGNTYYFGTDGMLVIRIIQFSGGYIQDSNGWILPQYSTTVPWNANEYVINRFERGGVLLPVMSYGPYIQINANCGTGTYCSQRPPSLNPNPCPSGYQQVAYDKCCTTSRSCICANGYAC